MRCKLSVMMVAILLLAACSKKSDYQDELTLLEGTWEWEGTAGGIVHQVRTPASTGKNIDLRFTRNKEYFVYTNGVLTSQGTFQFGEETCIHDHTEKPVIVFSPAFTHEHMIESLNSGKLELDNNAHDGTGSSYRKK